MAETLSDIVESSEAERLATGFVFTEGPLWPPDGYLLFVDIRRSYHTLIPTGDAKNRVPAHLRTSVRKAKIG